MAAIIGYMQKGTIKISQLQIWAFIAQTLLTYVFIQLATSGAAKQNSIDSKRDIRATKEDIMSELKDTREAFLRESEISTKAIIDIVKAEITKENAKKNGSNMQ